MKYHWEVKYVTLYHYIAHIVNRLTLSKIFADNFELNLDKIANKSPYLLVVLGDFNVKSSNWYKRDKTIRKCNAIDKIIFNMDNKTLSLKCERSFL